jgi:GT2 family glycosyltransferase
LALKTHTDYTIKLRWRSSIDLWDAAAGECMKVSIIIPVWNGAAVVESCLRAVAAHSGADLLEVIAVDNASGDDSTLRIERTARQNAFPIVLLRQPVNLGFAGGVNVGLRAARGDLLVLLNQDCIVEPGWLTALCTGLHAHPEFGVAGCTLLNPDASVNHAGAVLELPLAMGHHLTEIPTTPRTVDYVTGAVFAIRRATWERVGELDDGFYPAYYEETDYCFRARRHGFEIGYVPAARVRHLANSRAWQDDPLEHFANQQRMRYRFVAKHLAGDALSAFFLAELAALDQEPEHLLAMARLLGARTTRRALPAILARRAQELAEVDDPVRARQLETWFTTLERQAMRRTRQLMELAYPDSPWARALHRYVIATLDRLTGANLLARSRHRTFQAARLKLLEALAEYDVR